MNNLLGFMLACLIVFLVAPYLVYCGDWWAGLFSNLFVSKQEKHK